MVDEKETIITSLEEFSPGGQDFIEDLDLGGTAGKLRVRVVPVSELVAQALRATEHSLMRALRDQFIAEYTEGVRSLPLMETINDIQEAARYMGLREIRALWLKRFALATEGVDGTQSQLPNTEAWDTDQYRKEWVRLELVETLLSIERERYEDVLPRALLDLGQDLEATALSPEELIKRSSEVIEREINERRIMLREIPWEDIKKRVTFLAASGPAYVAAQEQMQALILYACTKNFNDRTAPALNLTKFGYRTLQDILRDPPGAYAALIKVARDDEALLRRLSNQVVGLAGTLTPEAAVRLERAAQEPFRPRLVRSGEGTGDSPGVGDNADNTDTGTSDVSVPDGTLQDTGEGDHAADYRSPLPTAARLDS